MKHSIRHSIGLVLLAALCGCEAPAIAQLANHSAAIVNSNVMAQIETTPDLPDTLGPQRNDSEDDIGQGKRRAYLIVADFPCAPCEEWKSRIEELPFDVTVQVKSQSPTGSFPCLWYPNTRAKTGWSYWSGKPVDEFLDRYDPVAGCLESLAESSGETTRSRATPAELREWCRGYTGPLAYVRGMSYADHICDERAEAHGGEAFERWQLAGLTTGELQKIHGAQHNGGLSPFSDELRDAGTRTNSGCPNGKCPPQQKRVR